jgi:predicted AAA+ superfamily ATPase
LKEAGVAKSQAKQHLLWSELADRLHLLNPWWTGKPIQVLPASKRHLVAQIQRRLQYRIAPILVVRGSRQVGKTTACLHVISELLRSGVPRECILRVQFDEIETLTSLNEPIIEVVDWYQRVILLKSLNEAAAAGQTVYVFFDEVQNLKNWAEELKFVVDSNTVQVVVTGSSALRIEQGRDSLAGRIHTLEAGVLSLTEIGLFRGIESPAPFLKDNGLEPLTTLAFWQNLKEHGEHHRTFRDQSFSLFSDRGAYPLAHMAGDIPWPLIADQLNETVIKRVIQHDLRVGHRGRKRNPMLLEEVFRYCCRYAGQSPSQTAIAREIGATLLTGGIAVERVHTYVKFLAESLLIRVIPSLELRMKKKRSDSKICLVDHGLRASWLQERISLVTGNVPVDSVQSTLSGFLAESVSGSLFSSISGLDIAHLPARGQDPEIDFVLTVGDFRIPVEVKYRNSIEPSHVNGLSWFMSNPLNRAPFGILLTKHDSPDFQRDDIVALPLSSAMLLK